MKVAAPYLLFIGDVPDSLAAKTAQGVADWRPDWCLGQHRLPGCGTTLGIPDMTIEQAVAAGARTFVIGAANAGGFLPDHWISTIVAALEAGLDVASGLHVRLEEIPGIAKAAEQHGCALHSLRHPTQTFTTGKGNKRSGRRLLTVGTDCSVGKKYAALSLLRDMQSAGLNAQFCATGQTGILIAGRGVALDAVIADFISGAAEWLSPDADEDHWHVIEGQGSLFHPSFAGVTLGLLHGSQPDAFVVCHEPTRRNMRGVAAPIPGIDEVIDQTVKLGQLTNPAIACAGICINTQQLDEDQARAMVVQTSTEFDLPCTDPIRFGTSMIVDGLKARFA
ncbi:MAG: N-acetyltransferase DgcN [Hyphomicrobiaceae bacterium]